MMYRVRVRVLVLGLMLLVLTACTQRAAGTGELQSATPAAQAPPTSTVLMGGAAPSAPAPVETATAVQTQPAASDSAATTRVRESPQVRAALESLNGKIEAERERRNVAGLSVAVIYDQSILWSGGFGTANMDTGAPATPQTIYRVGSITKLFTDTMLLQLRDQGRLTLDDPLSRDLPEFNVPDRYSTAQPTFRQVASHTSGLPREAPLNYWRSRSFPTEGELLASLADTQMIAAPGTAYQYSNLGVAVMGAALERVAGEDYQQYVTEHVLRPLGMRDSGFQLTDAIRARMALGTSAAGADPALDRLPDFGALAPAAELYSTVDDMAHFISLQFRDGDSDSGSVLAGRTLQEMHNPGSRGSGPGDFAIGWELGSLSGHSTVGHPGVVYGFTTQITLVPDSKLGVAVFTNGRTDPATICSMVLAALLQPVSAAAGG